MEKFIFDLWAFGISGSFSVPLCLRGGFCFPMTAMSRDHGDGGDFLPLYYPCAISPSLATCCGKSFFVRYLASICSSFDEAPRASILAVKDGFAHKYWVYIVASRTGTLYTGMTGDLFVRIMQHKAGEFEGLRQNSRMQRLVYFESLDNVHVAINREKQIKSWRRQKKIALIEKTNPRWQDLAQHWGSEMLLPGQSIKKNSLRPHGAIGSP